MIRNEARIIRRGHPFGSRAFNLSQIPLRRLIVINPKEEMVAISQIHPEIPPLHTVSSLLPQELVKAWKATRTLPHLDEDYRRALQSQTQIQSRAMSGEQITSILRSLRESGSLDNSTIRSLSHQLIRLQDHLSPKDIRKALNFFILTMYRSTTTVPSLLKAALNKIDHIDEWGVISILRTWSKLKLHPSQHEFYSALKKNSIIRLNEMIPLMDEDQLAGSANVLSMLNIRENPHVIEQIHFRSLKIMHRLQCKHLGILTNSFATLDFKRLTYLDMMTQHLKTIYEKLNPIDVVHLIHGASRLEYYNADLFNILVPYAASYAGDFSPKNLTLVSWGVTKAGHAHEVLMRRIGKAGLHRLVDMNGLDLSMFARSFALCQYPDFDSKLIFKAIADEILYRGTVGANVRSYRFNFRQVTDIAVAFQRSGTNDPKTSFILSVLSKKAAQLAIKDNRKDIDLSPHHITRLLHSLSPKYLLHAKSFPHFLTNLLIDQKKLLSPSDTVRAVKSCANLSIHNKSINKLLLAKANNNLSVISASSLIDVLNAFSRLGIYKSSFARRSLRQVNAHLPSISDVSLSRLYYTLSMLRYRDEQMTRRLGKILMSKIPNLSGEDCVRLLAANAQLRVHDKLLIDNLLGRVSKEATNLSPLALSTAIYSLCILRVTESVDNVASKTWDPSIITFLLTCLYNYHRQKIPLSSITHLNSIEMFVRLNEKEYYDCLSPTMKNFLLYTRQVNIRNKDVVRLSSRLQKDISKYMNQVGLFHRQEVSFGCYTVDMLIGDKLVVEVDGVHHFFNDTNMRTGKALYRNYSLRSLGLNIVSIPYQEWSQCGTANRKLIYAASLWRYLLPQNLMPNWKDTTKLQIGDIISITTKTLPSHVFVDEKEMSKRTQKNNPLRSQSAELPKEKHLSCSFVDSDTSNSESQSSTKSPPICIHKLPSSIISNTEESTDISPLTIREASLDTSLENTIEKSFATASNTHKNEERGIRLTSESLKAKHVDELLLTNIEFFKSLPRAEKEQEYIREYYFYEKRKTKEDNEAQNLTEDDLLRDLSKHLTLRNKPPIIEEFTDDNYYTSEKREMERSGSISTNPQNTADGENCRHYITHALTQSQNYVLQASKTISEPRYLTSQDGSRNIIPQYKVMNMAEKEDEDRIDEELGNKVMPNTAVTGEARSRMYKKNSRWVWIRNIEDPYNEKMNKTKYHSDMTIKVEELKKKREKLNLTQSPEATAKINSFYSDKENERMERLTNERRDKAAKQLKYKDYSEIITDQEDN